MSVTRATLDDVDLARVRGCPLTQAREPGIDQRTDGP
jgi:hypothetical protein